MEIFRNPLIKTIGLILVIYFALFHDKKNPDSLGNRLSSDRIVKNFREVQERSVFIMSNIEKARNSANASLSAGSAGEALLENFNALSIRDVEIGEGDSLKCGDEAEISYDIRVVESINQLEFVSNERLVIGSNKNPLMERKIVGMKKGGTRIIKVPKDFKSSNQKLSLLLRFNEADLQYSVTLINFNEAQEGFACSKVKEESKNAK